MRKNVTQIWSQCEFLLVKMGVRVKPKFENGVRQGGGVREGSKIELYDI